LASSGANRRSGGRRSPADDSCGRLRRWCGSCLASFRWYKRAGWRGEAILAEGMMESQLAMRTRRSESQNGKSWYTPGIFRMSGKGKDLQDTENERVRKSHKQKVLRMHALQYKAQFSYEWQAKGLCSSRDHRKRELFWPDPFEIIAISTVVNGY